MMPLYGSMAMQLLGLCRHPWLEDSTEAVQATKHWCELCVLLAKLGLIARLKPAFSLSLNRAHAAQDVPRFRVQTPK